MNLIPQIQLKRAVSIARVGNDWAAQFYTDSADANRPVILRAVTREELGATFDGDDIIGHVNRLSFRVAPNGEASGDVRGVVRVWFNSTGAGYEVVDRTKLTPYHIAEAVGMIQRIVDVTESCDMV